MCPMDWLSGKVAWVTGGGSGIGRAVALELARQGADVAVSGRRRDRLEAVAREIEAMNRRALAQPCDVRDEDAVRAAVAAITERLGRLDVAVANAGMSVMGRFETLSDADWRRQMNVNLFGAINTARHALPELRKTGGRLVLVGSVSAMLCTPRSSAYSASKFALRAVGLTLAQELYGSGVSCTLVHPGFVESEIALVDNEGRLHEEWTDRRPGFLMWPADRAARVIVWAARKRKLEVVFTGHGKLGAWLGRHFPGLVHFLVTRIVLGGRAPRARATDRKPGTS